MKTQENYFALLPRCLAMDLPRATWVTAQASDGLSPEMIADTGYNEGLFGVGVRVFIPFSLRETWIWLHRTNINQSATKG